MEYNSLNIQPQQHAKNGFPENLARHFGNPTVSNCPIQLTWAFSRVDHFDRWYKWYMASMRPLENLGSILVGKGLDVLPHNAFWSWSCLRAPLSSFATSWCYGSRTNQWEGILWHERLRVLPADYGSPTIWHRLQDITATRRRDSEMRTTLVLSLRLVSERWGDARLAKENEILILVL